jgi:FkbM family methyltransferase
MLECESQKVAAPNGQFASAPTEGEHVGDPHMQKNLIYDVGLHSGEDTDFYLRKGFDVVGIEANPSLCQNCEERFAAEIKARRLKIINQAISEVSGTIDFYVNEKKSLWGTADPDLMKRYEALGAASRKIQVRSTTMKEIFEKYGIPYYMKVDIEGYDHLCLKGLVGCADKPKYISVEASGVSIEETMLQLNLLKSLGYAKFHIVLQNDAHKQICPRPPREGKYIDYQFGAGTSGLFGKELPGRWLNYNQVVRSYQWIYWNARFVGPHVGVFRDVKSVIGRKLLARMFSAGTGWYDTHATY